MIHVQYMKPFYTKMKDNTLRLVFAYQYFSIRKEEDLFHFIPIEGKEMIVNLDTMQVENLSEVFVFQKGNRFLRLPLYQLLLISNIHEHLAPILENITPKTAEQKNNQPKSDVDQLIQLLVLQNVDNLIDEALATYNEEMFYHLVQEKAVILEDYTLVYQ